MNDSSQHRLSAPRTARLPALISGILLAALLIWGWFDVAARLDPHTGELLRADDYHVYRAAAVALREGRSPYDARSARGWPYLYPPLIAILIRPLAALPPRAELYSWFLLNVVLALAAAPGLARIAAAAAPTPSAPRAVFLWPAALALFPLVETLHRGQVNVVILCFVVVGMLLLQRGRPALAGFSLAAASAVKVTPLLIGVWLLWKLALALVAPRRESPRAPLAALLGFLIGVAFWWWGAPALVLGPHRATQCLIDFRAAVTQHYLADPDSADSSAPDAAARMDFKRANQSWYHLFHRPLRDADPARRRLADRALLAWLALLFVATLLLSRSPWREPAQPRAAASPALLCELAALIVLALTAGRLAWNHSWLLAWPLLLFAGAAAARAITRRPRRRLPVLAALAAFSLLWLVQMTAPSFLGRFFPLLLSTSALAAGTLIAWRTPLPRDPS